MLGMLANAGGFAPAAPSYARLPLITGLGSSEGEARDGGEDDEKQAGGGRSVEDLSRSVREDRRGTSHLRAHPPDSTARPDPPQ